jgi:hypothetical protein
LIMKYIVEIQQTYWDRHFPEINKMQNPELKNFIGKHLDMLNKQINAESITAIFLNSEEIKIHVVEDNDVVIISKPEGI